MMRNLNHTQSSVQARSCRVILLLVLLIGLAPAKSHAIELVTTNGDHLTRFDSSNPTQVATVQITGMQVGETLLGIDFRPSNGLLYGVGNTKRLYTLNSVTGAATQVGGIATYLLGAGSYATAFNPVDDVLRMLDNISGNRVIDPDTNVFLGQQGALSQMGICAVAYTSQYPDASTTTLYGINAASGKLVRIGPDPAYAGDFNTGGVTDIGSMNLGTNLNQTIGFDIAPDGTAYAAITVAGESRLYTVNLTSGIATLVGNINNGATPYRGLAVPHGPITFTGGTVLIPAAGNTSGVASPYSSATNVSGMTGVVTKLIVKLNDFRHHFPADVDILLAAPPQVGIGAPLHAITLLSDVGGSISTCGAVCDNGSNAGTTGVNLTFDDAAANLLPDLAALSSGTFKPTNFGTGDTFPLPAPTPPYSYPAPAGAATLASTFNGIDPNGIWTLWIVDDNNSDSGRLGAAWSIQVTSAPACALACPGTITVNNDLTQCGAVVSLPKPGATGACGTIQTSPPTGTFFPVGTTPVTITTSRGSSCSFNVTVNDTQKPAITCHANITVPADPGQNSAVVNFNPPGASDNCLGVTATYSPPSGSFFVVGTTTVTGTATDAAGNTMSCSFTITVTPNGGPTPTPTPPASSLANISTRLRVETGDNVLIGGFIITGSEAKKLIVRAIGPSLPFGNTLANPQLQLFNSSGISIASNDNWKDALNMQEIMNTIPPSNDLESAILGTLSPGAYTAIVSGVGNGTGVGLVELYDLSPNINSKLANISSRGLVQTGDNVMIAGTIVVGQSSQQVVVRGIGPSLPLPGNLANPTLELRDSNGNLLEANDDWVNSANKQAIIDAGLAPTNDLEAAIIRSLPPANYTAILQGAGGTSGVAVVEVYALN